MYWESPWRKTGSISPFCVLKIHTWIPRRTSCTIGQHLPFLHDWAASPLQWTKRMSNHMSWTSSWRKMSSVLPVFYSGNSSMEFLKRFLGQNWTTFCPVFNQMSSIKLLHWLRKWAAFHWCWAPRLNNQKNLKSSWVKKGTAYSWHWSLHLVIRFSSKSGWGKMGSISSSSEAKIRKIGKVKDSLGKIGSISSCSEAKIRKVGLSKNNCENGQHFALFQKPASEKSKKNQHALRQKWAAFRRVGRIEWSEKVLGKNGQHFALLWSQYLKNWAKCCPILPPYFCLYTTGQSDGWLQQIISFAYS